MRFSLEVLSHVGRSLVIASWIVLFLDVAAMVIYTIRSGSKNGDTADTVSGNQNPVADNASYLTTDHRTRAGRYRSKVKILAQASGFVTDDALVDGSATLGQRMMVRGIKLLFTCLWLIMVSFGLWVLNDNLMGIYMIVAPSIWFSMVVWNWRKDRKAAVRRVASRRS